VVQRGVLAIDDEILVHFIVAVIVFVVAKLRFRLGCTTDPPLLAKTGIDSHAGPHTGLGDFARHSNGQAIVGDTVAIVVETVADLFASI
jgi:hypothetical protein